MRLCMMLATLVVVVSLTQEEPFELMGSDDSELTGRQQRFKPFFDWVQGQVWGQNRSISVLAYMCMIVYAYIHVYSICIDTAGLVVGSIVAWPPTKPPYFALPIGSHII